MPKHKTHKGIAKRIKITARGKIKRKKSGAGHLMSDKSGSRCRNLRRSAGMSTTMTKKTRQALGQ